MWAAERFAALVAKLRAERWPNARCIVFAGPGEQERRLAEPALNLIPGAIDAIGGLAIPQTAACLQRCTLFIGNDSGLMHLSAAAEIPTIGLCAATLDRADEMSPAGLIADWSRGDGGRDDAAFRGSGLCGLLPFVGCTRSGWLTKDDAARP